MIISNKIEKKNVDINNYAENKMKFEIEVFQMILAKIEQQFISMIS